MPPRRARFRRFLLIAPLAGGVGLLPARDAAPTTTADDEHIEFFDMPPFVVEGERGRPELVPLGGDASRPSATASLTGALTATSGLIVQDGGDGFYPPRVTVRGSGLQSAPVSRGLLLRLEELPLNAADGSFNLALLEPAFFGTFSFQPGAADSSAAVQALGGALDFSWWRSTGDVSGSVSVTVGSDGAFRAVLRSGSDDARVPLLGRLVWGSGGFAVTRRDGWRPNSEQERLAAAAQVEWPGRAGLTQSLSLYAVRVDLRIPGPLTLAAAQSAPDTISTAAAADLPRRTPDYAWVAYRANWTDGPEVALGVQASDDDFRQLRANGIAVTRGADCFARLADAWTLETVRFEAGFSAIAGMRRQDRFANGNGAAGVRFADLDLQASTLTGWLDATWKPARNVTLKGGCSAGAARREACGTATAAGELRASRLAPHLEIAASPPAKYGLRPVEGFVRVERGVEAPTYDDLLAVRGTAPNLALVWTPLRAQTADTVAAGVRGRLFPSQGVERLSFEVTAYTGNWRNELLRLADADGSPRGTVNAGPTRHRGVESQLRWRLLAGERTLDLAVAHTWSEARFAHDPVYGTSRLAGLPPQVASVQLRYAETGGFFATFGTSWVSGTTYADHANRIGFSGHTLANVRLGWQARRWTFGLEVDNLFDRRYIASTAGVLDLSRTPATTALFLPGNPRSFTATLEWRW